MPDLRADFLRFGEVDYGSLEEFTQLTLTVDGEDIGMSWVGFRV